MSSEDEARAVLLDEYERTIAEASERAERFERELAGAANALEREYLGSRIARFQALVDETRAKAEVIRRALSGSAE
jgi:hypothetical protein